MFKIPNIKMPIIPFKGLSSIKSINSCTGKNKKFSENESTEFHGYHGYEIWTEKQNDNTWLITMGMPGRQGYDRKVFTINSKLEGVEIAKYLIDRYATHAYGGPITRLPTKERAPLLKEKLKKQGHEDWWDRYTWDMLTSEYDWIRENR